MDKQLVANALEAKFYTKLPRQPCLHETDTFHAPRSSRVMHTRAWVTLLKLINIGNAGVTFNDFPYSNIYILKTVCFKS